MRTRVLCITRHVRTVACAGDARHRPSAAGTRRPREGRAPRGGAEVGPWTRGGPRAGFQAASRPGGASMFLPPLPRRPHNLQRPSAEGTTDSRRGLCSPGDFPIPRKVKGQLPPTPGAVDQGEGVATRAPNAGPSRTARESASSRRTENRRRLKARVAQGRCSLSRCWLCSRPHCSVSLRKIRNWKSLIEKKKKSTIGKETRSRWEGSADCPSCVQIRALLPRGSGGFRGVPGAAGLPAESHGSLSVCTQKPPRLSSCT